MKKFLISMRPELAGLVQVEPEVKLVVDPISSLSLIKPVDFEKKPAVTSFRIKDILKETFESERSDSVSKTGKVYMRASHLYTLCPREEALYRYTGKTRIEEKISTSLGMVFAYGHLLHYWAQNDVFGTVLLGVWECLKCKKNHGTKERVIYRPQSCECGSSDFRYVETYYYIDGLKIGGHPDGFVFDAGELQLVDFKTSHMEAYDSIERWGMSKGYVWQAQVYLLMTGLNILRLIYINKNGPDFKEKIIRRDETIIAEIKKKCDETITVHGTDPKSAKLFLPERSCAERSCTRAKNCKVAGACFREKDMFGIVDRTQIPITV